jgi:hypothetical protein
MPKKKWVEREFCVFVLGYMGGTEVRCVGCWILSNLGDRALFLSNSDGCMSVSAFLW